MSIIYTLPNELLDKILVKSLDLPSQFTARNVCSLFKVIIPKNKLLLKNVSKCGYIDILKWAKSNVSSFRWNKYICSYAAYNGHLNVIEWAHNNGCPWDEKTCTYAAISGHLNIIVWIRSQIPPCPWNEYASISAAKYGQLEVLKYLHHHECEWSHYQICNFARRNNHLHILEWYKNNVSKMYHDSTIDDYLLNSKMTGGTVT